MNAQQTLQMQINSWIERIKGLDAQLTEIDRDSIEFHKKAYIISEYKGRIYDHLNFYEVLAKLKMQKLKIKPNPNARNFASKI